MPDTRRWGLSQPARAWSFFPELNPSSFTRSRQGAILSHMRQFKRVYIEITNVCNLECGFCPRTSRKPEFMARDIFGRILNEVRDHSKYLRFHVMGEPLLHPDIGLFLDMCHEAGCNVNIATNGTLIKKVKDQLLSKPALRSVNFSLHILDEYEGSGGVDGYLGEIFEFIDKARKGSGLIACFRLWNIGGGGRDNNEYVLGKIQEHFSFSGQIDNISSRGNGIKIADNVYVSQARSFDWPDISGDDLGDKGFCLALRDQAAILVDGTVVPCCLDSEGAMALGNIKETGFSDIISSPRARAIYEGFSQRKLVEPLCKKCGYRTRFDL
jgi:radical SAM protein with 4Fe4S-binding SPASM domain